MVETVCCNYEGYKKRGAEKAIAVWHLQGMLGNPSDKDFLAMACAQMILYCAFTIDDSKHTTKIFGKKLPDVIGETV